MIVWITFRSGVELRVLVMEDLHNSLPHNDLAEGKDC